MLELLKTHFGYDSFLPHQEEIISSVMAGNDSFVLLPTGGGKSLCYQLPALAFGGLTLVVSPLIALMKDQVDSLRANGVPGGFINSSLTASQIERVQARVREGNIKILYVAPERAELPEFKRFLGGLDVSLIAIDEAHCVSEWGHDFRPAYRGLKALREACPQAPMMALTATATRQVRDDILSQLGLRDPSVFVSSFNRPNLTYSVRPKKRAFAAVVELLERRRGESAIIYCLSRKSSEELARSLTGSGVKAEAYHAGMDSDRRRRAQDRFIRDEVQVVVATIAFGMGIDKPDIRLVVHYDLPKSIEGYYQETGRAGRDGAPSECVLFYAYGDQAKFDHFISLIEDTGERERSRWKLEQIVKLCGLRTCRRRFVLEYLGEERAEENCGGCDVCLTPHEQFEATEISQKILSAVIRTGERFGVTHVTRVLTGSKDKKVLNQGHQSLPVYGIAADHNVAQLRDLVEALVREGLLSQSEDEFKTLRVTPNGREFLKNRDALTLTRPVHRQEPPPDSRGAGNSRPQNYDPALFEKLSALRKRLADELGVPAYVVFGNRTLEDMARKRPRTAEGFARVSGVGDAKLSQFGQPFLELLSSYVAQNGTPGANGHGPPDATAQSAKIISDSYLESGRLVSSGLSLSEAAETRGLKETTILGHLERLALGGVPLTLDSLMLPPDRVKRIEDAFANLGYEVLRPVWEELGEEISYDELRLVRIGLYAKQAELADSE